MNIYGDTLPLFGVGDTFYHMALCSASLSGVLKFARLVKMYETQDPEIAAMSVKLKSLLLPPLSTPPIGGAIPAS